MGLIRILRCFYSGNLAGLNIFFNKNNMYKIGVCFVKAKIIANLLRIHLDLAIIDDMVNRESLQKILEKFEKKLSS